MMEILCRWLNEEVQLSRRVDHGTFLKDLSTGYLIGEILNKHQLQNNFDQFSQGRKNKVEAFHPHEEKLQSLRCRRLCVLVHNSQKCLSSVIPREVDVVLRRVPHYPVVQGKSTEQVVIPKEEQELRKRHIHQEEQQNQNLEMLRKAKRMNKELMAKIQASIILITKVS